MGRREALQGARMANIPNRWESAELNQAEAAESLGASEGAAQGGASEEARAAAAAGHDAAPGRLAA